MFVSVGYSACHWCHVMAHESFEDRETAAVMNDLFVNVKVDREERPDVDSVYMDATQAMTGQGGWPMSVFCTPEGEPFFTGTYFPKERRHGLPGFLDVCTAVADAWRNRRDDVLTQAGEVTSTVRRSAVNAAVPPEDGELPGPDAARGRRHPDARPARRPVGRVRRSSQVSAGDEHRRAAAGPRPGGHRRGQTRGRGGAGGRRHVARRDGGGRDLRPPRRGVRPVLGRRRVARPPFREDAVRPGPAAPGLPPRLAAHRGGAVPAGARGDGRVRATRPPAYRRRVLLRGGRRLRGRGGQVLRLEPRADRGRVARPGTGGQGRRVLGSDRGGQLRGRDDPEPHRPSGRSDPT